jgi:hypothetical protein
MATWKPDGQAPVPLIQPAPTPADQINQARQFELSNRNREASLFGHRVNLAKARNKKDEIGLVAAILGAMRIRHFQRPKV